MDRKPVLPVALPIKQRATMLAANLSNELARGQKAGIPIGKYGVEICKLFKIPLAPGENPVKIAFNKLCEWRHAVSFGIVKASEYEYLIPKLQEIYGQSNELGIRGAIATEIKTRDERRRAMRSRQPKEHYHRRKGVAPLYYPDSDPYGD